MRITESRIKQIIKEEARRSLLGEAENPNYFSDEYESQDEDPNFFDDESDYDSTLDGHNEEMDYRGMEELVVAYDDLINSGYSKQEILNFIMKQL
jgi:hypothetical protein